MVTWVNNHNVTLHTYIYNIVYIPIYNIYTHAYNTYTLSMYMYNLHIGTVIG